MNTARESKDGVFHRAWKIIERDASIPLEEKERMYKTIRVLIKAAEMPPSQKMNEDRVEALTREVLSKHALIALVKQQADELDVLKNLSLNLTSSLDLQAVLDAVVNQALRLVKNAHSAHIYLYSNGHLNFGASLNASGEANKPFSTPRPGGLTNSAVDGGEQIVVEDISNHPLYKDAPREWSGSIISIPLKANDAIVGVMNLSRSITGEFPASELRLLGLLADQAAVAISNARLHKVVKELANTDSATSLPNRRALDERLEEEIRHAKDTYTEFAVVMMDLDGFKEVNDNFGHAVGDEFLKSLFVHLAQNMRETDFLARYGGDELTLIMRNSNSATAEYVTRKIIEMVRTYQFPFPGGKKIEIGITAGIAIYPLHTRIPGDLLRAADSALYHGKKHNRGSYVVAKKSTGPLDAVTVIRKR